MKHIIIKSVWLSALLAITLALLLPLTASAQQGVPVNVVINANTPIYGSEALPIDYGAPNAGITARTHIGPINTIAQNVGGRWWLIQDNKGASWYIYDPTCSMVIAQSVNLCASPGSGTGTPPRDPTVVSELTRISAFTGVSAMLVVGIVISISGFLSSWESNWDARPNLNRAFVFGVVTTTVLAVAEFFLTKEKGNIQGVLFYPNEVVSVIPAVALAVCEVAFVAYMVVASGKKVDADYTKRPARAHDKPFKTVAEAMEFLANADDKDAYEYYTPQELDDGFWVTKRPYQDRARRDYTFLAVWFAVRWVVTELTGVVGGLLFPSQPIFVSIVNFEAGDIFALLAALVATYEWMGEHKGRGLISFATNLLQIGGWAWSPVVPGAGLFFWQFVSCLPDKERFAKGGADTIIMNLMWGVVLCQLGAAPFMLSLVNPVWVVLVNALMTGGWYAWLQQLYRLFQSTPSLQPTTP